MGSVAGLIFGTLSLITGTALIAVGFGTHSWRVFEVSRPPTHFTTVTDSPPRVGALKYGSTALRRKEFFSRAYGLFHECFTDPIYTPDIGTHRSPLGQQCIDVVYNETITTGNPDVLLFIHLKRTTLALYVVGLLLCVCSILTLLMGCSNSSHRLITVTGVFLFFAASFVAAAIGVWHKVVLLDEETLEDKPSNYRNWDEDLKSVTRRTFGWSYITAWVGVGVLYWGAIIMFIAGCSLRKEEQEESKEIADSRALVPMGAPVYGSYDKSGLYASPYSVYPAAAYMTYGYNNAAYSPYSYYPYSYPYYYPYYTMRG